MDPNINPSEAVRVQILDAAMPHIPFEGWTSKALSMAVKDCDLPQGADELYFPGGPKELIEFWASHNDLKAIRALSRKGIGNMRIRDKITEAVWIRLNCMRGQEQAARRAISRLMLPDAIGQGPKQLWSTADMIWRAIGDTSTDANFYSKRAILSGVIGSTMMAWLSDDTDDKVKARAFLEARIANVMSFEKAKFSVRKQTENWPAPGELMGRLRYRRRRRRY